MPHLSVPNFKRSDMLFTFKNQVARVSDRNSHGIHGHGSCLALSVQSSNSFIKTSAALSSGFIEEGSDRILTKNQMIIDYKTISQDSLSCSNIPSITRQYNQLTNT